MIRNSRRALAEAQTERCGAGQGLISRKTAHFEFQALDVTSLVVEVVLCCDLLDWE